MIAAATLVIDPVLTYSTYFGGSGNEACSAIARVVIAGVLSPPSGCPAVAIDASSNIYFAGSTTSADFPVVPAASATPPAFQTALAVAPDVFVTKLNAAGSAVVFSTYLGGDGAIPPRGWQRIPLSTWWWRAPRLPVIFPSAGDGFSGRSLRARARTRLSANWIRPGDSLLYSTYLSGNGTESARGLALDSQKQDLRHRHHDFHRPARRDPFISRHAGRDSGRFAGYQPVFCQQG